MSIKGAYRVVLLLDAVRPAANSEAETLLASAEIQHARIPMLGSGLPMVFFNGQLYPADSREGLKAFLKDFHHH